MMNDLAFFSVSCWTGNQSAVIQTYLLQTRSPTPMESSIMRAATDTMTMITTGLCSLDASATGRGKTQRALSGTNTDQRSEKNIMRVKEPSSSELKDGRVLFSQVTF